MDQEEADLDLEDMPLNYYQNAQFKPNSRYIPVPVTVAHVSD